MDIRILNKFSVSKSFTVLLSNVCGCAVSSLHLFRSRMVFFCFWGVKSNAMMDGGFHFFQTIFCIVFVVSLRFALIRSGFDWNQSGFESNSCKKAFQIKQMVIFLSLCFFCN